MAQEATVANLTKKLRVKKEILDVAASLSAVCKGEKSGKRIWELIHLIQMDLHKLLTALEELS